MLKQVGRLTNHFIVCGAGETAHHLIQELVKTGHHFVVIDHDEERLEKIQHLGDFPVVKGEATEEEVLESAGFSRAQGLVSVLPDDRDNLMVVVTARQKSSSVRIVARCTDARVAEMLMRAGANSAVSPSLIGGLRLASELIRPHVVSFLDLMLKEPSRVIRVEEISVPEGSSWAGKTLQDTEIHRRFGLLALALRKPDGETTYNPQGDIVLAPRDVLIVMGDVTQVWNARQSVEGGRQPTDG
jgi:voltage-gated potassium channel